MDIEYFDINFYLNTKLYKTLNANNKTKLSFLLEKLNITNNKNHIIIYNGNIIDNYDILLLDLEINNDTNIFIYNIKYDNLVTDFWQKFLTSYMTISNQNNYTNELTTLNELGFNDNAYNTTLLTLYSGNIDLVIASLLE